MRAYDQKTKKPAIDSPAFVFVVRPERFELPTPKFVGGAWWTELAGVTLGRPALSVKSLKSLDIASNTFAPKTHRFFPPQRRWAPPWHDGWHGSDHQVYECDSAPGQDLKIALSERQLAFCRHPESEQQQPAQSTQAEAT
jgi:hypothetical protein